jgi:hypothetical protein
MSSWITLKIFPSRIEAEIAKSFLESNGITAEIKADDFGGIASYLPVPGGIKLLVKEEDLQDAQILLK